MRAVLLVGLLAAVGWAQTGECAGCHAGIAASYGRTAMARSFQTVVPGMELPEFGGQRFGHVASGQTFTAVRREGRYFLRRETDGGMEKEVHYVFGSGNHARSFLHRTDSGRLVELPLTWYRDGWGMSPAFDRADHPGFTREISFQCFFCHNAYPAVRDDGPGASAVFPAKLPEGIDCQRCHGPGEAHAKSGGKAAIVNPGKLDKARQLEVCLQCHLETTSLRLPAQLLRPGHGVFSYRAGEPLGDYVVHFSNAGLAGTFDFVSAATRMRESACFRKSEGRMTCTSCHDPHTVQRGAAFDGACRSCHTTLAAGHTTAGDCAGCHMPKRRPGDVIHAMATDHLVAARPSAGAEPTVEPTVERHDGNTPPLRGPVTLYYPERLEASAANELLLAAAQVKDGTNLEAGLAQLGAALRKHAPLASEAYFAYAEGLRGAGRIREALGAYERAVARKPALWTHRYGYGLALAASGDRERAVEEFRRAAAMAPLEASPWVGMGAVFADLKRFSEAAEALRRALGLAPELAEARNNLGTALLGLGQENGAEAAFREAVRVRPDLSVARLNLANLLIRLRRFGEAAEQAAAAVRTDSTLAVAQRYRGRLSWGIALQGLGKAAEARAQFTLAAESGEAEVRELARQLLERR